MCLRVQVYHIALVVKEKAQSSGLLTGESEAEPVLSLVAEHCVWVTAEESRVQSTWHR